MESNFQKYVKQQKDYSEKCAAKYDSHIVFGTVKNVDPLEIEMETGDILPSKRFYLTDNVIVKKVRFIVHRMYGEPTEIEFEGTASEVSNAIQSSLLQFNIGGGINMISTGAGTITGLTDGAITLDPPPVVTAPDLGYSTQSDYSVSNITRTPGHYEISMDRYEKTLNGILSLNETLKALRIIAKASDGSAFRLEFTEAEGNTPEINKPQQNQTTAIEGIIWQGLKTGDICLMTSHNHGQKYLVHRIINRDREQYEQSIWWDSRLNDIPGADEINRH
ncbi:MAG: DUF2577 family protein [Defluviitaleaceae bacterium]|nr:DUF2577 family protein [Defluviitaleaceae bacterium]MCL2263682.1 DUF2577 family protein [Defluviitaleaceae bacterium]